MTDPHDQDRGSGRGLRKNRARLVIVATFALILVVAFGYMFLVGVLA